LECLNCLFDVPHNRVLSDLQAERTTWEVVVVEAVCDEANDVPGRELRGRHVDSHGEMELRILFPPDGHLAARLRHDPSAKVNNKAGFLGYGDEAGSGQYSSLGMVPPHERLDGEQSSGAEVDLGLVVQQEATIGNCVAEK
jgi:hypothetical protein